MKFESEKLENLFKIVGGQAQSTTFHSSTGATGCDTYEAGTNDGVHTDSTGFCDYLRVSCKAS